MAWFAVALSTGSRVDDVAKLLAAQVLRLPSSQRLVLNFQLIETLRDGAAHASLLALDEDRLENCPRVTVFFGMRASGDRTRHQLASACQRTCV